MSAIHFAVIVNANISWVIMYQMLIKNIIEYKIVGIYLHSLERNENNEHYQKEVLDLLDYQKVLADLQIQVPEEIRATMQSPVWTSPDVHLVLLCYEKPTDFCHRHLFAEWLSQKAGIKIEEFQKEKL